MKRCRECGKKKDDESFTIFRDGKRLLTALCAQCIAKQNVLANRRQKGRLK